MVNKWSTNIFIAILGSCHFHHLPDKKIKVAFPPCLDKFNNRALRKTAFFGWWDIPWGIIRTQIGSDIDTAKCGIIMITPSDKEYTQTKRIKLGIDKMKPEFLALARWIDLTFDVKTLNIIYDTVYKEKPRLQICFEFEKERRKFLTSDGSHFDKARQKLIADKFEETIEQQNLREPILSIGGLFSKDKSMKYKTDDIFVIYGAFEPIAKQEATTQITEELKEEFIHSFNNPDIWTISIGFIMPTFFMFTDEKVKEYNTPEIRKNWAAKYYELIKPFDEFNYFKKEEIPVFFDSKENFDNNYESNWYYYYK